VLEGERFVKKINYLIELKADKPDYHWRSGRYCRNYSSSDELALNNTSHIVGVIISSSLLST